MSLLLCLRQYALFLPLCGVDAQLCGLGFHRVHVAGTDGDVAF